MKMPPLNMLLDIAERIFICLLAGIFWTSLLRAFAAHPYVILLAISETLSVVFILFRKPGAISTEPMPVLAALLGSALPLLARPGGHSVVSPLVFESMMIAGLVIAVSAKLYLNTSFGMVAANRGVKIQGPYRFVRHPMYTGYFLTQLGFLLSSFDLRLLAIYLLAWMSQIVRIGFEERILSNDPAYRAYSDRVRWRAVPGAF